jgi:hypothetical protein
MKAFTALMDIVPGWIWAICCAGLFGWGGINAYRATAAKAETEAIKAAQAQALADAVSNAWAESDRLQKVKDDAIADAEKRAKENAAVAGRARSELDRLRRIVASASTSTDPACKAVADRAAALGDVFGECAGELTEMGRKADAHASDLRTFQSAWPEYRAFQDRLNTFTNTLKGQP